jgi:hypothetical protein
MLWMKREALCSQVTRFIFIRFKSIDSPAGARTAQLRELVSAIIRSPSGMMYESSLYRRAASINLAVEKEWEKYKRSDLTFNLYYIQFDERWTAMFE